MGWISKLLNKSGEPQEPSNSTGFHDIDEKPIAIALAESDVRAARELVHQAAVYTAQLHGLPARWLSFEVVTISDAERAYFQLQILLHYWDEYLMAHCHAYELAVLKKIREENIDVGRAVRAVLWKVTANAGCPYDQMPDPGAWTSESIKQRALTRDRINRELYAQHYNGLLDPAVPSLAAAAQTVGVDLRSVNASTVPADNVSSMQSTVSETQGFKSTLSTEFADFVPTQSLHADQPKPGVVDVSAAAH
jgi:hypothetical protein